MIGDEVLVETVVAVVRKEGRDSLALCIQLRHVELHALVNQSLGRVCRCQQRGNGRIPDVVINMVNEIGLARLQQIGHVHLLAFHLCQHLSQRIQESLVTQLQAEVGTGLRSQLLIVDHRRLTHRAQRAVQPLRGIAPRQRIGGQGQFHQREPAPVGHLPHIALQRTCVDIAVLSFCLHFHAVEQILAFGHIFRSGTR